MTHIRQRRDTALNWTTVNPVLHLGEVGWETDTRKAKLGDGVTVWTGLAYVDGGVSSWGDLTGKPAVFPPAEHNHDTLYSRTISRAGNGTWPNRPAGVPQVLWQDLTGLTPSDPPQFAEATDLILSPDSPSDGSITWGTVLDKPATLAHIVARAAGGAWPARPTGTLAVLWVDNTALSATRPAGFVALTDVYMKNPALPPA